MVDEEEPGGRRVGGEGLGGGWGEGRDILEKY